MNEVNLLGKEVAFTDYDGADREMGLGIEKVGIVTGFPDYMNEDGELANVLCADGSNHLEPIKFLTVINKD